MKKFVLFIILFSVYFEAVAQNRAIDTIQFLVPQVNVADEGLLVALDSMTLAYLQESPNATKTMVWYLTYLDKDMDGDSENKMDFLVIPSSKIIPNIEKSDGYFSYKDHLFFIGKRNDQRKRQDPVFAYSNTTNSFYYIKINWNLLWNSDIEESIKIS